jgi:beta-lactamase regulating signal transducer with metallopeptidase domain
MLGWFVDTMLVASGLTVVAVIGSRLRSIGPTTRHALWLVVLVRLVTPPLFCWPWAAHWGGQNWLLISGVAAPEAAVVCTEELLSPPSPFSEAATFAYSEPMEGLNPARIDFRIVPVAMERAPDDPVEAGPLVPVSRRSVLKSDANPDYAARLAVGLTSAWVLLTVLLGAGQARRIIRFRGRLRSAVPAPEYLFEEAERIARSLAVRVPELLVVPDLRTPLVWCLGRPKLLLPTHLVKTLDLDRWRGILTHELAHIRRGDHWVSRLELAAGLIWWWNPIYWLARARLDAEAELACDAWVVSTLPKDRLAYAEVLFNIFSTMSMARVPAPALGAAGSGRFFERRLTMILHGHTSCRLSPLALLTACLLVLFALPSWSTANPAARPVEEKAVASFVPTDDVVSAASIKDDDDDADDDDADDDDDDADDDDDDASIAKAKADIEKAKAALKKAEADIRKKAKADGKKAKADGKDQKGDFEFDFDFSKLGEIIEKAIEGNFGPDFEKKMEELGERIEKEIEDKFGPDFEKKMEEFGEKFGKDMEAKFGPGSDFEKKMKELGEGLEAKLGPGSDFEKKMKELGKDMEAKFGPGSDFEKKIKEQAEKLASDLQKKAAKKPSASEDSPTSGSPEGTAVGKDRQRERRIAVLEAQIRKLADELKALKAGDN